MIIAWMITTAIVACVAGVVIDRLIVQQWF